MGFIFSGLFWGIIVVLVGLSIILNVVAGVKIPLFRVIFGLLLIYWGVSLLAGASFRFRSSGSTVFGESDVRATETGKQDVIFGKGTIDLTRVALSEGANRYEVNTVFGSSVVRVDPAVPTKVVVSSAFAGARLPDGNNIAFGEYTWRSPAWREDTARLVVKVAVVFGSAEVRDR
jgi:predicted membrane protein